MIDMLNYFLENSNTVFYLMNDETVLKNKPDDFNIHKDNYMFSVEQKNGNVIFVLDFDGENGLTPELWKIGCEIYEKMNRNSTTYIKPSGNKGMGIFTEIEINGSSGYNWREFCLRFAYSLYLIWNLREKGINFGYRERLPNEISCIDIRMFEINRKFRGVGKRNNGNYSIISLPTFDYKTVNEMIINGVSAPFTGFETVLVESPKLLHPDIVNMSVDEIKSEWKSNGTGSIKPIECNGSVDDIYDKLPIYLKHVVDNKPDMIKDVKIRHFHKLWLVQYIYHYLGIYKMDFPQNIIMQFFKKYCKFDINFNTTFYQIKTIIEHIEKVTNNDEYIGIPKFITDKYINVKNNNKIDIIDLDELFNETEEVLNEDIPDKKILYDI